MPLENISRLRQTEAVAEKLVKKFQYPQLVLLKGEMGSGKTQMVRFMCSALGCREVCSPAFTLVNIYSEGVAHIDLYRLKNREDLESTGFWDLFTSSRLVFIEWADLLKEALPPWNKLFLSFAFSSDGGRFLKWKRSSI